MLDNAGPRDQECFAVFARALPEFNAKVPVPAGILEEIRLMTQVEV